MILATLVTMFGLSVLAWVISLFFIRKTLVPMWVAIIFVNIFNVLIQLEVS
jgi:hypothetical protein